jgi:hypothetical protein
MNYYFHLCAVGELVHDSWCGLFYVSRSKLYSMSTQPFYGKGPHPLLWDGSRAALGKTTVSGIPNCLNYCVIFIVYTWFTNVVTDHYWWIGNNLKGSSHCLLGVLSQHSPGGVKNSVKKFRMANDVARIQTRYLQNTKQVTICRPSACEEILFLSHTESGLCN